MRDGAGDTGGLSDVDEPNAPAPSAQPSPLSSTSHHSVLSRQDSTAVDFSNATDNLSVAAAESASSVTTASRESSTLACALNLVSMKKGYDGAKKKEAKKLKNKRSYLKRHFENQISTLNGESTYNRKKIQFVDGLPVPGHCFDTNRINWRDAYQMSVSGNVVLPYTRSKEILENHVIVWFPDGSYEAIEEGQIRLDPPPQVTYRSYHMKATGGTLVQQYTKACSGRGNNKRYVLIRYTNKQYQWVPEEEIILFGGGGKRSVRKPNYYQNDTRNGDVDNDQLAEQNDNKRGGVCLQCVPAQQYTRFRKIWSTAKDIVSIEPSTSSAVTEALAQHPVREGTGEEGNLIIKRMTETSLLYELLTSVKKEGKHLPLEDVIGDSVGYVAGLSNLVRSGNVLGCEGSSVMVKQLLHLSSDDNKEEERGKAPTEQPKGGEGESSSQAQKKVMEDSAPGNDRKEKMKKPPRKMCKHRGCMTPAHQSTMPHCIKHSEKPKQLCVNCQKNAIRRRFKLCDPCFLKLHPNESLCRHCSLLGYKRKPREFGGLCAKCIADGVGDERMCVDCHKRRRERLGGRCYYCHKISQKK